MDKLVTLQHSEGVGYGRGNQIPYERKKAI